MSLTIIRDCQQDHCPDDDSFSCWVNLALATGQRQGEVTICLVDENTSRQLNHQYRGKDKPTNVLSFPFDMPPVDVPGLPAILGDLVICVPLVAKEARMQNKAIRAHWAHLVIHGCLHLLGHDHIKEAEAEEMENLEIQLMQQLGFANPYLVQPDNKEPEPS